MSEIGMKMQVKAFLIQMMVVLLSGIFLAVPGAVAHEEHGGRSLLAAMVQGASGTVQQADSDNDNPAPVAYVIRPWRALRDHLHNKIVHVPIGFALAAFLLSVLGMRGGTMDKAIQWLVLAAAAGALAAFVTGSGQAAMLEGSSKEWVVDTHRMLGIATMIGLWLWAAAWWVLHRRRVAFLLGVLTLLLVVTTGFFGGILAYG